MYIWIYKYSSPTPAFLHLNPPNTTPPPPFVLVEFLNTSGGGLYLRRIENFKKNSRRFAHSHQNKPFISTQRNRIHLWSYSKNIDSEIISTIKSLNFSLHSIFFIKILSQCVWLAYHPIYFFSLSCYFCHDSSSWLKSPIRTTSLHSCMVYFGLLFLKKSQTSQPSNKKLWKGAYCKIIYSNIYNTILYI